MADLQLLAKMPQLTTLHLNVSYPHRMVNVEYTLSMLLVRQFPVLAARLVVAAVLVEVMV